jgi:hypothetical protein
MFNYIYYLFGASIIGSVGFGMYYIVDPQGAQDVAQYVTWNGIKCYHKVKHNIKKINRKFNELQKKQKLEMAKINIKIKNNIKYTNADETEKNDIEFIGYKLKDDTTFTTYDFNNNYIFDNEFDLMFLKKEDNDKNIYKRILDVTNLKEKSEHFELIKKPFVQIELEQNNEKTSIHKKLQNFYVKNNKILDGTFLTWFIKYKYFITLEENYNINIIDSNINMFKLNSNENIVINDIENGELYKIHSE